MIKVLSSRIQTLILYKFYAKFIFYKSGNGYCLLYMKGKFAITFYNPSQLLNQRSEIFNACRDLKNLAPWQIECVCFLFLIIKCRLGQLSLVRIIQKILWVKPG